MVIMAEGLVYLSTCLLAAGRRSMANTIQSYIGEVKVQSIIKKSNDRDWLWEHGQHSGEYPHLNYLCTIYIHPLTHAQSLLRRVNSLIVTYHNQLRYEGGN